MNPATGEKLPFRRSVVVPAATVAARMTASTRVLAAETLAAAELGRVPTATEAFRRLTESLGKTLVRGPGKFPLQTGLLKGVLRRAIGPLRTAISCSRSAAVRRLGPTVGAAAETFRGPVFGVSNWRAGDESLSSHCVVSTSGAAIAGGWARNESLSACRSVCVGWPTEAGWRSRHESLAQHRAPPIAWPAIAKSWSRSKSQSGV